MSADQPSIPPDWRTEYLGRAADLRPELHRYCARLMGSVIDGEDVVQDTIARAWVALQELTEPPSLRPWLFRIAHNRAFDLLRGRAVRSAEPIEAALDVADPANLDSAETLMHQEAVRTAVSRFTDLPTVQRSVVILKDVLDESLIDIANLLGLTVNATKAHLARGRARLREINEQTSRNSDVRPASAAVARYVALFNQRNWDELRALLADDVRLVQSSHSPRVGSTEVGAFFGTYAKIDGVRLAAAWLDDREVIAVYERSADSKPSYMMWLEWRDNRVTFIRDYRYVRYVIADIELAPARDEEVESIQLIQLSVPELRRLAVAGSVELDGLYIPEGALPPAKTVARTLTQLDRGTPAFWCVPFLIVSTSRATLLGSCGFKTAPVNGIVEISYGIARGERGRGVATTAITQLLRIAASTDQVERVVAHILPQNLASSKLVARLGFSSTGSLVDTDGALVTRWELNLR